MYSLLKDAQSYESSNEYDSSTIHYTLIHYVTGLLTLHKACIHTRYTLKTEGRIVG